MTQSQHGSGGIHTDRRTDTYGSRTTTGAVRTDSVRHRGVVRRLTTETKQAFKTTEFWAMLGVVVAILVSAAAIKGGDTSGPMSSSPDRHGSTWPSSPAPI